MTDLVGDTYICAACGQRYPKTLATAEPPPDSIRAESLVVCATCWINLDRRRKALGWPASFPVHQGDEKRRG